MLYLLLLASLLHVPTLGVLGQPCGQTVKTHTLTQTLIQTNPNGNVTQTYHLNWTSMVIHVNILTMAAPRENPHRDTDEEDPARDPRGDPPGRPVPAPRAIQLTVK